MTDKAIIFNKIKVLLEDNFKEMINESFSEMYISIRGIYIGLNERELIVGERFVHYHYESDYDSFHQGLNDFFNLLTKRKRITEYFKGDFPFKRKIEIELSESNFEVFGIEATWLFPYWKRTTEKVTYQEKLIDNHNIENAIEEIKNCAQHRV